MPPRKIGSTIDYAQEALKKESSRLETASMAGQVALWEWDIRSGGIEWSGAVDAMLGYEPGGLPRTMKSWEQSIYPDDRDRVIACLTEHLERKAPYDVEYRVIRRDGSSAWWHDVGSAQWDGDGRAYKMAGACADITERKHAEETLKAANSYNRSLIEASLDPLATIDATGKITDVNAATESVTGYGKKELVGTDFSDYFTDPEKAREGYQLVFRKGTVRDYPLEIRHRDGRVTPVLYNAWGLSSRRSRVSNAVCRGSFLRTETRRGSLAWASIRSGPTSKSDRYRSSSGASVKPRTVR